MIGEAWEFYCDPELPSLVAGTKKTLADFAAEHRDAVFGSAPGAKTAVFARFC